MSSVSLRSVTLSFYRIFKDMTGRINPKRIEKPYSLMKVCKPSFRSIEESNMKRAFPAILSTLLVLSTLFGTSVSIASAKEPKVLKFNSMVGVPAGLTGTQSLAPMRGINGGGIPWAIGEASGELKANGHLEISVQGLVLAAGANAGSNPVANFAAIVSCVKSDGTFANIQTGLFPATTGPASAGGGNAEIETDVTLPQPCIAPIVFVTSPTGSWFAATGF
jgi:hypothetical protein